MIVPTSRERGTSRCYERTSAETGIFRTISPFGAGDLPKREAVDSLAIHSIVMFIGCIPPCPESSCLSNPYARPSTGVWL
ncbi:hypothetical protein KMW35_20770 [Parabacteroides distasonis]|nr:hypothetical protein [Parabacteroides distasonis]